MAWQPVYASSTQMKKFIRVDDNVDDQALSAKLETASRNIDDRCNRQFGQVDTPVERVYRVHYRRRECRYAVDIDDLMTTTDLVVEVDGVSVDVADLKFRPRNAAADNRPWTRLILPRGGTEATITAQWGWLAIPVPIQEATMLQANRLLERPKSPYGTAGTPSDGSQLRLLAKLDPDADRMAGNYWRARWVA